MSLRALVLVLALVPVDAASAPIGDAARGQAVANQVCAVCHGSDGNSPLPANPNLAGQHPEYLYKQLREFKSGVRSNPIMMGMVTALSDEDLRNVAAHYAAQRPRGLAAQDAHLVALGRKLFRGGNADKGIAACAGCHSPNGAGIPVQYPRIAGQHAEYTANQLRAFRAGERANDENQMMRSIASRLSDQEISALADYLAGLR
ncbi:MAG TPA: c-type cytochrome [Burkholderiales bacterium]|nr:c-type cytochrome [Burkholderiales bacterium]